MKASDVNKLMKGNIIDWCGRPVYFVAFDPYTGSIVHCNKIEHISDVEKYNSDRSTDEFEFIILTKEWFMNLGYKPRNKIFKTGKAIECFPVECGVWFSKRDKDNYWTVMDHEHAVSSIQFVHELQNIVAIIDRKELKLIS